MDVGTSNFSAGRYQPQDLGNAAVSQSSEGLDQDQMAQPTRRTMPFGDSFSDSLSAPLPRRTQVTKVTAEMDPRKKLQGLQAARYIALALAIVSCFVFGVMILQPILLPLFTFGYCFAGGAQEWMDFSCTALKISVIPLMVGLASLAGVWYFTKQFNILSERIQGLEDRGLPVLPR